MRKSYKLCIISANYMIKPNLFHICDFVLWQIRCTIMTLTTVIKNIDNNNNNSKFDDDDDHDDDDIDYDQDNENDDNKKKNINNNDLKKYIDRLV